jgi:hypothetical protein
VPPLEFFAILLLKKHFLLADLVFTISVRRGTSVKPEIAEGRATPMRFRLSTYGRAFSTRPRGSELLAVLEAQASNAPIVDIDFDGVTSISYSFADEFVGVLMRRVADGEYEFQAHLEHVPAALRRVILRSLENRGLEVDAERLFSEVAIG